VITTVWLSCITRQSDAPPGRDTDPVAEFVDPTPPIEERIAPEVGSLREVLTQTTDPRDRKRLERELRRPARQIRLSIIIAPASWWHGSADLAPRVLC
jgi:hypothetical protein